MDSSRRGKKSDYFEKFKTVFSYSPIPFALGFPVAQFNPIVDVKSRAGEDEEKKDAPKEFEFK